MVRKTLFAAASAAAITAMCATAASQAAPILVEVEGPIQNFQGFGPGTPRVLTVMDIPVIVDNATNLHTPTTTRADSTNPDTGRAYNLGQWYKGDRLQGRSDRGFIGGTAIVLGTFDPDYEFIQTDDETGLPVTIIGGGAIIADDVFSEPAENVVLGQITAANCTNSGCSSTATDATSGEPYFVDYIVGNNGTTLLPIMDARIAAPELLTDEFGFALDLGAGAPDAIVGREFGVEGYYGDVTVLADIGANGTVDDVDALHYFSLVLTGADASLLANPDIAEIAAARAQCRDVDELEVRGGVHTVIDPATGGSAPDDPVTAVDKTIRILDGAGNLVSFGTPADILPFGAPDGTPIANDPFGEFRIRDRGLAACPTEVEVQWIRIDGALNVLEILATTGVIPTD